MNQTFKVEGLILKRVPYGEGNHILTIFSKENGKISLFIKKWKKISPSFTSPLTQAEFILHPAKGELFPCEEISPLSSFLSIREKVESFETAFHILKAVTVSQYSHKPAPNLYTLAIRYLNEVSKSPYPHNLATSFFLKTMRYEGIFGLSHSCATCQMALENTSYVHASESFCFDHAPSHLFSLQREELDTLLFLTFCLDLSTISQHISPRSLHKKVENLFQQSFHM